MQLRVEAVAHVRIVRLRAHVVDASNANELRERLREELRGARHAILCLSQVSAVDGDGLTALCTCWRDARACSVALVFCDLPGRSRFAVRLLGLDAVLTLYDHLTDALDAQGVSLPTGTRPELLAS